MSKSCVITNINSFTLPKKSALASVTHDTTKNNLQEFKSIFEYIEEDLLREDVRLKTFTLWPGWSYARPADLAETGMYFTGQNDTVKCVECSLEVTGWVAGQVPSQVHKEKSPYCPMVTHDGSRNIPRDSPGSKKHKNKQKPRVKQPPITSGRNEPECRTDQKPTRVLSGKDIHANDLGVGISSRTRGSPNSSTELLVPDLKVEANRHRTFEGKWSENFPVKAAALAKAGFYFIGPHDRVVCAFCNGKVYNWIPGDSPVGEHTRLFPNCSFVQDLNKKPLVKLQTQEAKALQMLGHSEPMIQKAFNECEKEGVLMPEISQLVDVIHALADQGEMLGQNTTQTSSSFLTGNRSKTCSHSFDNGQLLAPEVVEIQRENEALKASNTCKVCLAADVHCVFLPCGHLVCCMQCADQVENCPLCRTKILGSVKTYRA